MSDPTFRPCRHQRDGDTPYWHRCEAPRSAAVVAYLRVTDHDCAACPIPQAEAELRERIISRIESMMSADGAQAYTRDRVIAIVREELPE